jgi:hypothetical protein
MSVKLNIFINIPAIIQERGRAVSVKRKERRKLRLSILQYI